MAKCVYLEPCPFFNDKMAEQPATAELYKQRYCLGQQTECARYLVREMLGKECVPADLLPNSLRRAEDLIRRATQTKE